MSKQEWITNDTLRLVKLAFWMAWEACHNPGGMGWLQDCAGATAEDVWKNILSSGDYGEFLTSHASKNAARGDYHADYVFGRMMKLGIFIRGDSVFVETDTPRLDYQAWCCVYSTYEALLSAAAKAGGLSLSPGKELSWEEWRKL